jgi:hypothetical protein
VHHVRIHLVDDFAAGRSQRRVGVALLERGTRLEGVVDAEDAHAFGGGSDPNRTFRPAGVRLAGQHRDLDAR